MIDPDWEAAESSRARHKQQSIEAASQARLDQVAEDVRYQREHAAAKRAQMIRELPEHLRPS